MNYYTDNSMNNSGFFYYKSYKFLCQDEFHLMISVFFAKYRIKLLWVMDMYVDYKEVGRRIALRRKSLGLKQNAVNEKAGLSDKYLSNIETARSIPSIDVLMRICDALNTTPDCILLGAIKEKSITDISREITGKFEGFSKQKQNLVYKFITMLDGEDI